MREAEEDISLGRELGHTMAKTRKMVSNKTTVSHRRERVHFVDEGLQEALLLCLLCSEVDEICLQLGMRGPKFCLAGREQSRDSLLGFVLQFFKSCWHGAEAPEATFSRKGRFSQRGKLLKACLKESAKRTAVPAVSAAALVPEEKMLTR